MRVSVNDKGYFRKPYKYNAFLNGKELKNCIIADDEKGKAEVYKKDENGNYLIEGDKVATEIVYGKIEIRKMK